ncbi:MAG: TIGR04255 family protein [Gemmataceae bacterium]|nr:TIGR04255 family protein [Gemmataceae bacterium]
MADEKTNDCVLDNPPVIETVLGVQFAPLKGLTSAHAGWFWKTCLDHPWEKVAEVIPIPDEFERFEPPSPGPKRIRLEPVKLPARVQISDANAGRMIQLQPTRFHYNWNRVGGEYPHYRNVRKGFDHYFQTFCRFVTEAQLGEVAPNQWELTYIDSIPRGQLWDTPADWYKILPGLFPSGSVGDSVQLESLAGEWHYEIPPQHGRLHVSVQLARVGGDPTPVLLLQTTARGPVGEGGVANVGEGLDLGHRVAVETFFAITSADAHKAWERRS